MPIEKITIENYEIFYYDKALNHFNDNKNVLKISKIIDGINMIDFTVINDFIGNLDENPNIYGLHTKLPHEEFWTLRYIGQRKSKDIKQRLYQHLVKKHINTGAQLNKINLELSNGKEIGIKLISIFPDELRHYYEEKLLKDIKPLDWNIQK